MHYRSPGVASIGRSALLLLLSSGACAGGDLERDQSPPGGNPPGASGSGSNPEAPPTDTLSDDGLNSSGPSTGCGLASPMSGELTLDIDGRAGEYAVV